MLHLPFQLFCLILHIRNAGSFQQPLTAEKEAEYLKKMKNGDLQAREILIERNMRLVAHIVKKYYASSDEQDDLISIGTIGLIKAVNTFCADRNIKLATYASRCIENEILMYLRKNASQKNEISIDEPLNIDWDGNELLLSDVLGSEQDEVGRGVEQEDERVILNGFVNCLSPREKQIMEMRFGMNGYEEFTQKEVADSLGISQSYISRLEKRIINKLKKQIEKTV